MDYLNESTTLYVYKINSNEKISFVKNSVNVVTLEEPQEFECIILNKTKLSAINTDSDTFSNHLYDSYSLSVTSEFNELFNDSNAFYFFTFQPVENNANFKDFYIAENKIDNFQIMEALENLNEITITQLDYYKELQSMDFIVVDNKEQYNKFKNNEYSNLNIEINNGALINHINFLSDNNELIKMKLQNEAPFLLFVNPFRVKNNSYALNFWSLENYNLGLFKDFIMTKKADTENNEFINKIKELYTVTKSVRSNFKNFNEGQLKEFKSKYGDITDLKSYSNQYIKEISDRYIFNGEFDKYLKWNAYILASSNYLFSDYCWKGGLNNEYMFYSALQLNMEPAKIETSSRIYKYNPEAFSALNSKTTSEFLNGNVFNHFGKNIQFPLLGEALEEIDYSQNPVDFNNKSFNFNYPVYLWAKPSEFKRVIDYASYVPEPDKNEKNTVIIPCFIQETITQSGIVVKLNDNWQSISLYATNNLYQRYKELNGRGTGFFNIFEQNEDIKIPIKEQDEQFYYRARRNEWIAREFGNINESAVLKEVKLLSKVGHRDWQRDNNNYINFLKIVGINDYNNPIISQQNIYDSNNIQWGAWGDAKLYFLEYTFAKSDTKNFEQYFNSLNTTVFTQKEQLQKIMVENWNTSKELTPINIFLNKESNSNIKKITVAGFWLDYIKIPEATQNQTIKLNNIYTKIIFW
ncbi:hypothetical protein [Mycoplasma sp. BRA285]